MTAVGRASSSEIIYYCGPSLKYEAFCKQFIALIKAEKYAEAKYLLATHKPFISFDIISQNFFDTGIQEILGDTTTANGHLKVVEFARIVEEMGFPSEAASVYRLGGLISLGKLDKAAAYLEENPNLKQTAEKLHKAYELLERPFGPRKYLIKAVLNFTPPQEK